MMMLTLIVVVLGAMKLVTMIVITLQVYDTLKQ